MSFNFNENFFMASMPNINTNEKIRQPQYEAYEAIQNYYSNAKNDNRNALVVLPTGVGKTGIMALAPFGLCKKRTLIITPGNTIKNSVLENLNPENPMNFWYSRSIFQMGMGLPNVIEYEGANTTNEVLNASNIVILNIHKLQERLDSSLLHRVDSDFFDFIIIDEAHHSTADTWTKCIDFFKNAKVLKLTGTPFRTDGQEITAKLIYKYPLSRAMYHGYVKSLQNIKHVPDELKLTIDGDESKEYTIDEIFNLGLRDQDWVTRTVAYSTECSLKIVDASIESLYKKLKNSKVPHKIIAIACSISHAKKIAKLYEQRGIKTAVIHSNLPEEEKASLFKDIENHRVQAVINVAMLGEGYDHKYLSIAAIFRPFRAELPYVQFIGRVLRYIPEGNTNDNIAQIISHHHLFLDGLWEKYKKEINESDIIKSLKDIEESLDNEFDNEFDTELPNECRNSKGVASLGKVSESMSNSLNIDNYLDTHLIQKSKQEEEAYNEKIKVLKEQLGISEEQAKVMMDQVRSSASNLGRPDLMYKRKKKGLDETIREEIVPNLISKFDIDKDGNDLKSCDLFKGSYWYIPNQQKKNAAMIAVYFNIRLKNKIGRPRKEWVDRDFDLAFEYIGELTKLVEGTIKQYYN
ncbi:DEAD/DEAH box helicase [Romboutsia lituseburensis]|uniref:Superfamily II DNA or RNA helicase n=1 Tax=Romboutsia lituseburensis DSM 797 TaxID=1121325 RepID=A0A1G9RT86_9FIRM|nr:DEAD/DEAH box helicase family protein [Romboutsia lituseburensis]CEH32836.1 Type III restriction protein res subunit [Romboutsia lituseburensis]SDM26384.1 Superfamily II DNA or RNA helicase [Romboutsia lituseburensis DSM 797]